MKFKQFLENSLENMDEYVHYPCLQWTPASTNKKLKKSIPKACTFILWKMDANLELLRTPPSKKNVFSVLNRITTLILRKITKKLAPRGYSIV